MALVAVVLFGCSSSPDSEDDSTSKLSEPGACVDSHYYQGFLAEGASCEDVTGNGGKWEAKPLFPDAPESVRKAACGYTWQSSASPAAAPDHVALSKVNGRVVPKCESHCPSSSGPSPAPACASSMAEPYPSLVTEPGTSDPEGEGGAQGCDVCIDACVDCAIIASSSAYLVLPPAFAHARVIQVQTSDHKKKYVKFSPMPGGAQSYNIALPALPTGTTYVEGFTPVY